MLTKIIPGHFVAQLRLVFQPLYLSKKPCREIYAYVEPLVPTEDAVRLVNGREVQIRRGDGAGMYHLKRKREADGTRSGLIINVTDIWQAVDVIPFFGKRCSSQWKSENSVDGVGTTSYSKPATVDKRDILGGFINYRGLYIS